MKRIINLVLPVLLTFQLHAQDIPYTGGAGDGAVHDSLIQFDPYGNINMYSPFCGGTGDGYALDSLLNFDPQGYITKFTPYAGGRADGWAGALVMNLTLPVNLLSFAGEALDDHNLLEWSTAGEEDAASFDIERSSDGRTFSAIGNVAAAGTTSSIRQYRFYDRAPVEGANYYRLKQKDRDGRFDYSQVILIRRSGLITVTIFPNPAKRELQIRLNGPADNGPVKTDIIDMQGRILVTHQQTRDNVITMPVASLPAGLYLIRITWNNKTSTYRFIRE
jgi:hypothetical protein